MRPKQQRSSSAALHDFSVLENLENKLSLGRPICRFFFLGSKKRVVAAAAVVTVVHVVLIKERDGFWEY